MEPAASGGLADDLLDLDDDELGGLERREADNHTHDARVDIALGHRRAEPALHVIGLGRLAALERAGPEQAVHEIADRRPEARPEAMVVRFEDDGLESEIEALADHVLGSADRNVAEFRLDLRS